MDNGELNEFISNIKEKLGDESSALISDDLGILLTKNNEALKLSEDKDKEITRLNNVNEKLISANGSLLQQVSMGIEKNSTPCLGACMTSLIVSLTYLRKTG